MQHLYTGTNPVVFDDDAGLRCRGDVAVWRDGLKMHL